jgi:hypothetical protein
LTKRDENLNMGNFLEVLIKFRGVELKGIIDFKDFLQFNKETT